MKLNKKNEKRKTRHPLKDKLNKYQSAEGGDRGVRGKTLTIVWLNQEIRPYLFKYAAIAMRAANHVRVSQATPSPKHSFQVTTPVTRSTANPRMAAVTASMLRTPPKTQSPTCYNIVREGFSDQTNRIYSVSICIHLIKTQSISNTATE